MLRKTGAAVAVVLLAFSFILPVTHDNADSTPMWTELEENVSTALPAVGALCYHRCKWNGSSYSCSPIAVSLGCVLSGPTDCTTIDPCNICEFPCN